MKIYACISLFLLCEVALGQNESPPVPVVQPAVELNADENLIFRETANQLRCPTCQGMSILESDAAFSVQMKNTVKEKIRAGLGKEEVLAFFMERYGQWILRQPPKTGFSIVAWIVPMSLMILGPLGLWFFAWRKRTFTPTQGVRPTLAIMQEMESELSKLRGGVGP